MVNRMYGFNNFPIESRAFVSSIVLVLALTTMPLSSARAVPELQLDIIGGSYDNTTETVISNASAATVVALRTLSGSEAAQSDEILSETAYMSMAALKSNGDAVGLEELNGALIDINGVTFTEQEFLFGTPPDGAAQNKDLPSHSVYETSFLEMAFQFSAENQTAEYNTAETPGASSLYLGGLGSFFKEFTVSVATLADDVYLHFDLYTLTMGSTAELEVDKFAPFSHDAELRSLSPTPVVELAEPGQAIVFLIGLITMVGSRKRSRRFLRRKFDRLVSGQIRNGPMFGNYDRGSVF